MSRAAVTVFVFGWYIFVNAIVLLAAPNVMLSTLGLEPTHEPWLRLLGLMTLALSFYYIQAAREELRAFFRLTMWGRSIILVGTATLAAGGLVPPVIAVFGVIDGAGAVWTAAALRAPAKPT
jgi:hypothetical protein